ncbi:MAG: hypothetical protein LLF76_00890 [Planctomycetaceae bacterium]|nr:hypothetical protein [Planctomycetaceae bacterium]
MRRVSWMLVLCATGAVWAGIAPTFLPPSAHYQGRNSFSVNDGGNLLQGHVEFAVYDTQTQPLDGYNSEQGRYLYAYQVFNYGSSTAPLMYFTLLGANFSGLTLSSDDTLDGKASGGIESSGTRFEGTTKAIWDFANGTLIKGERSWFLFFSSNSDWVKGDYQVKALYNDDVPSPTTPEPLTLALLAAGAVLMRKRGKC